MTLHRRLAVASVVLSGLLSACAAVSPAADSPVLEGTAWVLSALAGRPLTAGATVTLRFDAGRASGTDGCNRYSSSYTIEGSGLEFGTGGASTQMACPPDVMQQAAAYTSSLAAARSYRVEGGRLQLLGPDGAVLATLVPQPQGLAGTSWRVTGYNNGRQAVVSVLAGTALTLAFSPDGRVSGSAGCNHYSATYTFAGESLGFGPAATTRKMCADPARIMEQEQQFLKALETVASARHEGDRLELRTADGALAVALTREPAR
jgi:heat shock protein HslJ